MVFKERQYFNQWWVWLFLIVMLALPLYGLYVQLIEGRPWGNNPMSDLGLLIFAFSMVAFVYFFRWIRLDSVCDNDGISIRFRPFISKRIPWNEINQARIVNYGFVGYGIRLGSKYGTVYNVAGKYGLAVETRNGKKFVIGTQRPDELAIVADKFVR